MSRSRTGAVVLVVLTSAALVSCAPVRDGATEQQAGHSKPAPAATSVAPPEQPRGATVPDSLRIPAIGVSTVVLPVGLNADRTVEVPKDPGTAGWFDQGPPPGRPGSAVILGHVDSRRGPAVFYRLSALQPGNRVEVRLSDGAVASFAVTRVVTYPNRDFPARKVYIGDPRRQALTLVTCGGAYDAEAGGYQANVVVYTRLLGQVAAGEGTPSPGPKN